MRNLLLTLLIVLVAAATTEAQTIYTACSAGRIEWDNTKKDWIFLEATPGAFKITMQGALVMINNKDKSTFVCSGPKDIDNGNAILYDAVDKYSKACLMKLSAIGANLHTEPCKSGLLSFYYLSTDGSSSWGVYYQFNIAAPVDQ